MNKRSLFFVSLFFHFQEALQERGREHKRLYDIAESYGKASIPERFNSAMAKRLMKYFHSHLHRRLINDGNYYLLAFSDKDQEMRSYRLDRMKDVEELSESRDGEHEFITMDLDSFTRRTFGMFSGNRRGITLRFINPLLDTVIDRFGTKGVRYSKADDSHFFIETEVDISDQFFAWLCGFGKKVKIMGPDPVIKDFQEYLDKIREMY